MVFFIYLYKAIGTHMLIMIINRDDAMHSDLNDAMHSDLNDDDYDVDINEESYMVEIHIDILDDMCSYKTRYRFSSFDLANKYMYYIINTKHECGIAINCIINHETSRPIWSRPIYNSVDDAIEDLHSCISWCEGNLIEYKYYRTVMTVGMCEYEYVYMDNEIERLQNTVNKLQEELRTYKSMCICNHNICEYKN